MNAPAGPGLSHLSAQQPGNFPARAVLRQMLGNEGLQQILDPVGYGTSFRFALLGRRIAAVELRRKHLLRPQPRLMKGYASVRTDGVFAELRSGTAGAVQHDEDLATLGRDLNAETGQASIPVDEV